MAVSLREVRGKSPERDWIERQLRDYHEDLGALNTGNFPALPEFGHREPDMLQGWLADPQSLLLAILTDQKPSGFALLTQRPTDARGVDFRMVEFFVARDARRRGVGRSAARLLFDRFAGAWEVVENQRSPDAVAFWRRTIMTYTNGDYRERVANGEVRQTFRSGARAR